MSIARRDDIDRPRWIALLPEAAELARMVANSNFVPAALRGNEAEIAAAVLYGDEIGLPPMQSLNKIAVIDGRVTVAAETLRGMILAAGHQLYFEEATTTRVTIVGQRRDSNQTQRVTWSLDDARRAGLAGKRNWRTYPRQMLEARASAELARAVFADVIGGLAASEELEDNDGLPPADSTPPEPKAKNTRRRRTAATTPVIAPAPPAAETAPPPALPDEEPPSEKATDPQRRKLFAMFREHGIEDRDDRLDWINQHLDRTVVSSAELTDIEAASLIRALDEKAGERASSEQPPPSAAPARPGPDNPVSKETLDILSHFRREANVSDEWLAARLRELGLNNVPDKITRKDVGRLTRGQARQLAEMLNTEIDKHHED